MHVDGVREVLAAQFNVDGIGLLADIAHQILGTENDIVVQGSCQAGHETIVMSVARLPLIAPVLRPIVNLARHRCIDEAGCLAVLELGKPVAVGTGT